MKKLEAIKFNIGNINAAYIRSGIALEGMTEQHKPFWIKAILMQVRDRKIVIISSDPEFYEPFLQEFVGFSDLTVYDANDKSITKKDLSDTIIVLDYPEIYLAECENKDNELVCFANRVIKTARTNRNFIISVWNTLVARNCIVANSDCIIHAEGDGIFVDDVTFLCKIQK